MNKKDNYLHAKHHKEFTKKINNTTVDAIFKYERLATKKESMENSMVDAYDA